MVPLKREPEATLSRRKLPQWIPRTLGVNQRRRLMGGESLGLGDGVSEGKMTPTERILAEQRRAAAYLLATGDRNRHGALLGLADWVMEEVLEMAHV